MTRKPRQAIPAQTTPRQVMARAIAARLATIRLPAAPPPGPRDWTPVTGGRRSGKTAAMPPVRPGDFIASHAAHKPARPRIARAQPGPMHSMDRIANYRRANGGSRLTPAQRRRVIHKARCRDEPGEMARLGVLPAGWRR